MPASEKPNPTFGAIWPRTARPYRYGRPASPSFALPAPARAQTPDGWPWHDGERAMQERAGAAEKLARTGSQSIRTFMPDQHRDFFAQLPFLLFSSLDEAGWPWASLLSGAPGFAQSPVPQRLDIAARPVAGDPLADALRLGERLGILGIELPTRRRNRMNGHVIELSDAGFSVAVDQSFGNCPQYIHRRDYAAPALPGAGQRVESFEKLDEAARAMIRQADTFFIASAADHGLDISHRGGDPGFMHLDGNDAITIPDYRGNRYFNTLGNLLVYPRAGLLLIDFASGDLLQITGKTEILADGVGVEPFPGAERLWRVAPSHGRWLRGAMPQRFAAA